MSNTSNLSLILVIITIDIALFGYVLVAYAGGPGCLSVEGNTKEVCEFATDAN